jgi:MFS family permease
MTGPRSPAVPRARFLTLVALRWLPTGLLVPVTTLLMLERGLSLPEVGLAVAAQGLVVFLLELPTGGLADALGRRPVLLAASVASLASLGVLAVADSVWAFVAVWVVQGVSRALDSGPLEAWFVDAALAADPRRRMEQDLGLAGTVLGAALAAGSLAAGPLVALGPRSIGATTFSALTVPVLAAFGCGVVHLAAVAILLTDRRRRPTRREVVGAVPAAMASALRRVRHSRVLLGLVGVEIFWGFGMVTFETLFPVRLADLSGDLARTASLLGPVAAAGWLVNAVGSALAPVLARGSVARLAFWLRPAQGATVVAMGLAGGSVGMVAAYLACYLCHGAADAAHSTLLHREADERNRASVLSLNSLVAQPAFALGGIALTSLAAAASTSTAILVGGLVLAAAAPLYLPARRAERRTERAPEEDGLSADPDWAG